MDVVRHEKAKKIRASGAIPYASSFERSATLTEAKNLKDGTKATIAGRIVLLRDMGKITFATLQDHTGRVQIAFREEVIGKEEFEKISEWLDLGDFIGVTGEHFTTQKGEPTILVQSWQILTKSLRQLPEKWHGIADQETAWRQRYLDTISNRETLCRET
jgi:lysyl-tRNA synthetase class 2